MVASIDEKDPLQLLNIDEHQLLKDFEDVLIDSLLILDSTAETVASLLRNYHSYCRACRARSQDTNLEEPDMVTVALEEQEREVSSSRRKIETLLRKVQGSIQLVRRLYFPGLYSRALISYQLSSLLDLGNGHSLKELAEEARQENTTMRKLTEKSTKDAAAVKVLTMITLIYLPATVVSVGHSANSHIDALVTDAVLEFLFDRLCAPSARRRRVK